MSNRSWSPSRSKVVALRALGVAWMTTGAMAASAPLLPDSKAESWWDASRADRIGFSDRAAAECRSPNCDSLQIRSCLNDRLKPPTAPSMRDKTIAEVTAACIAGFRARP